MVWLSVMVMGVSLVRVVAAARPDDTLNAGYVA